MSTLVVHGEDDVIPLELAEKVADAAPGARLSVLPSCGRFTYLEAPELLVEEVGRLFDR